MSALGLRVKHSQKVDILGLANDNPSVTNYKMSFTPTNKKDTMSHTPTTVSVRGSAQAASTF